MRLCTLKDYQNVLWQYTKAALCVEKQATFLAITCSWTNLVYILGKISQHNLLHPAPYPTHPPLIMCNLLFSKIGKHLRKTTNH